MKPLLVVLCLLPLSGCRPGESAPSGQIVEMPHRRVPWRGTAGRGVELQSEHYRIFTTVDDRTFLRRLPGFMEIARQTYRRLTGLDEEQPADPWPMYLLRDRNEWARMTRSLLGPHAVAAAQIENGGYTVLGVTVCWRIGTQATFSVLSHEGMHQFLARRIADRLPLWAEEALATACEGFVYDGRRVRFTPGRNLIRMNDLREGLLAGYWLPLRRLLSADAITSLQQHPRRALCLYGQWYALGLFLRSDPVYRPRWKRLIDDAEAGRFDTVLTVDELGQTGLRYHRSVGVKLFRRYIDDDLDRFQRRYLRFARRLTRLE